MVGDPLSSASRMYFNPAAAAAAAFLHQPTAAAVAAGSIGSVSASAPGASTAVGNGTSGGGVFPSPDSAAMRSDTNASVGKTNIFPFYFIFLHVMPLWLPAIICRVIFWVPHATVNGQEIRVTRYGPHK
jgi:hypothetical protein